MTYLDVAYRYGAIPGEREMRAIDGVREVYGVRGIEFNEKERTVRVGFDASRLKEDEIVWPKLFSRAPRCAPLRLSLVIAACVPFVSD